MKEFIFSKTRGLFHVALLRKLILRAFLRSVIIDFRIAFFTEHVSEAVTKIHKFLTSFMKADKGGTCILKSAFSFLPECIFY